MTNELNTTETQGYFDPEINAFASATALDEAEALERARKAASEETTVLVTEDTTDHVVD